MWAMYVVSTVIIEKIFFVMKIIKIRLSNKNGR